MNVLSKRGLFLFVLISIGACAHAQQIHFSDIRSLYSGDSTTFWNACKANGFERVDLRQFDSLYNISCYVAVGKTGLMRSFSKFPGDSMRKTFVLTYSIGADKQQSEELKKEIVEAGFVSTKHWVTNLPGNYTVEDNIYEKGLEMVSLQVQNKEGEPTHYSMAFSRHHQKPR